MSDPVSTSARGVNVSASASASASGEAAGGKHGESEDGGDGLRKVEQRETGAGAGATLDVEDHKPRLSKISWLPDVLVFRGSIIPTVLGPVLTVTVFAAAVAAASILYGKEVGLTNNVVPLLSVVVALLLVFRNSSAYERFAEGRKDFTTLISNARNLSRNIWITVMLPPPPAEGSAPKTPQFTRAKLTEEKKRLIRLIVAFVVATKHHLRAEGGVHHEDLRGLLPPHITQTSHQLLCAAHEAQAHTDGDASPGVGAGAHRHSSAFPPTPGSTISRARSDVGGLYGHDEEARLGLGARGPSPALLSPSRSMEGDHGAGEGAFRSAMHRLRGRGTLKRRPTAVRVVSADHVRRAYPLSAEGRYFGDGSGVPVQMARTGQYGAVGVGRGGSGAEERTPLIKAGVTPDIRLTAEDGQRQRKEMGLGRMVELGLPLIIAHEISRTIFRFRRLGCLETVGPAGMNAMQALVQSMTDQLGAMERIVQTPLPVIFGVHLKQTVTLFLFILPFTLVDLLKWKMVFIVTACAFTMMGVEHIAAQVEMPFGTDACDLNLDLFCTELLCECEAILERLPEGDADEVVPFLRSGAQRVEDEAQDDGDADDGADE